MKYLLWILASIWALTVAGSFYVSPDIQYQAIYGFIRLIVSIIGFVGIIWIGVKIHGNNGYRDDYYFNWWYSHEKKSKKEMLLEIMKDFWTPLLYLALIIGTQAYIWKSTLVENQITNISHTISDHIAFPWDGNAPRFYIWEKSQK